MSANPANTQNLNRLKSTVFDALSDPVRLEIMEFLRDGEKCVCDIIPHLHLIQPVVSRHLKVLRDTGLVRCRKEGNKRLYSVTDSRVYSVIDAVTSELAAVLTKEIFEHMVCH
ncbi:MAG: ArsR/SmtB family transcription factor [Candidatus Bathyarchaeia archaeon]